MINYKYAMEELAPPLQEPLSLSEVKNYLKVEYENDDELIASLISSARIICELMTGVNLINRDYAMYMDSWVDKELYLPAAPVVSVNAIKIHQQNNNVDNFSLDNFYLDNKNQLRPRIVLKSGIYTPIASREVNGIEIRFTSGFGADAENIPELLKQGMRQLIAYMYENRGDSLNNATKNSGAREIFKSYRKVSII